MSLGFKLHQIGTELLLKTDLLTSLTDYARKMINTELYFLCVVLYLYLGIWH